MELLIFHFSNYFVWSFMIIYLQLKLYRTHLKHAFNSHGVDELSSLRFAYFFHTKYTSFNRLK